MQLTVFTSVIGPKTDSLKPLAYRAAGVTYRCFTDNPDLSAPGWEMALVAPTDDPITQSRRLKILSHETIQEADATLWLDAAFSLYIDPVQIANRWLWRHDMLALRHPDRHSIAAEGRELVRLKRAPELAIQAQIDAYTGAGFPVET
mgnify:FL=1